MRPDKPPPITEKAFMRQVTDLAEMLGWVTYHPWLSIHSPRGWPDLALCRPPRLILAELKAEKGKVSDHQERWAVLLKAVPGVEYFLWRPSDIEDVAAVLQGRYAAPDHAKHAALVEYLIETLPVPPSRIGPDV